MITYDSALETVLTTTRPFPAEKVQLSDALGRILVENVVSDLDMPPHNMSAMDGFACRKSDTDYPLREIETIPAGLMPQKKIAPGQCSRIMTGAVVPEGADTVVMFEHTRETENGVEITKPSGAANIRIKAEDVKIGQQVMTAGTKIRPTEIAVLASVGCDPVPVAVRPRVGVIATGDELLEPAEKPSGAQIRNSNSYQLCAQITQAGAIPHYFGIAKDTPEAVETILNRALAESDVVLFSGGVSAGDFDFVPEILKRNKIEILFEKVKIKPGRPTVFGRRDDRYFFGLPGNPVSTFVLFEILVRPFLMKLMSGNYEPLRAQGILTDSIERKKADRLEFRPVRLAPDGTIHTFSYHGSAHIHAYTQANGLIKIPAGTNLLEAGNSVEVILLA